MKTNDELKAENRAIREMLKTGPEAQLLAIPGVIHVSVGLKATKGDITDQLCIRVYVKEKKNPNEIRASELIPREINGVPTDVNTVGVFEFTTDNTKYRPIKGGIQVTNRYIDVNDAGTGTQLSRGTMGCVAIDKTDNAPVLLSNWHVLTANTAIRGDRIFQPAPTSLPPLSLLDLPYRPPDDTDKIAILRRHEISDKVDGAIAAIDVSSCCNCCGIRYSNEINGLSVSNRPPRNTIVGDENAASGMTVFKVGQSTGRTEGVVVDDNYPSFQITKGGQTYNFVGQIAIQHTDHSRAFSDHGDSGSVVINLDNKIVGLIFAAGQNVPVHGVQQPFVSLANHISDVFAALNIRIEYSQNVVVNSGPLLADQPAAVFEAPIPEAYRALRERLQRNASTAALFAVGERHADEVVRLVNHCRPVMVAWHRCQGPAILATVMSAVRDGHDRVPATIKGVRVYDALEKMRAVLSDHGSPQLKESLRLAAEAGVSLAFRDCTNLNEAFDRLASDEKLIDAFEGVIA